MKDYTVMEDQMFRNECAEKILEILRDFENKTELSVEKIDILSAETNTGRPQIIDVEIDIAYYALQSSEPNQ